MKKNYKWTLIITCIVTLLPMLAGILLWNKLPDTIATHFGSDNTANGWSSKPFAVFGLPLILAAVQLFSFFLISADPKKKNINEKFFTWILWIIPAISCVTCLSCYGIALGMKINIGTCVYILVGAMFILIGNYMHKIKQNYTVGIKLPWTLNSEENWNRTHRMASWLWIIAGIVLILNSFLRIDWILIAAILLSAIIPIGYSYMLFRKGV